jgi:hypothetical protein
MPNFALPHKAGPRRNRVPVWFCCGGASLFGNNRTTGRAAAQRHCRGLAGKVRLRLTDFV